MVSLMGSDIQSLPVDPSRFRSPSKPRGRVFDASICASPVLVSGSSRSPKNALDRLALGSEPDGSSDGILLKHEQTQVCANVEDVTTLLRLEPWNTCRQVSRTGNLNHTGRKNCDTEAVTRPHV